MIQDVKEIAEGNPKTRALILDGWKKLAVLMGENWPALAQEQRHPWIPDWYNKAPWVKAYYGHIGHQLSLLETKKHFESILDRLKNPDAKKNPGFRSNLLIQRKAGSPSISVQLSTERK
jgi:hypothetical protein